MKLILCVLLSVFGVLPVYANDVVSVTAPPSIWARQQGRELTGPVVDLIREIFSDVNVRVKTKSLPWARAIHMMKTGEIDIMLAIFRTGERAQFMDFTIPYVTVPNCVAVAKGKGFFFDSLEDLEGKQGVMVKGDSISPEFRLYEPKLNMMKIAHYDQIIKMLVNLRADYAVVPQFGFFMRVNKMGFQDKIEMLPKVVSSRELHMGFSKKSGILKYYSMVNEKLKQFKADGSLDEMVANTLKLASAQK
ncbi:amino acid ABC transporter substrate-binding protein, PAAT family [Desulfocicer vacuolatum DSM 3385]|uniref:Amino acid ABC transporter substrate-binding protein, PAAT family n=1 Tax=Desulfocicer vacuolatum DSM 3385 TaxID=1121400 RepID=A0A1W2CLK1_9BACT|nr:transporter substrate-binding domain-containing protein [Desulfocicer vacuolatum]SMC86061.1 amino acid ABC transporter substrate-binding protein, PAAT family [Desulfocicer vacuolatum DSM 3385]